MARKQRTGGKSRRHLRATTNGRSENTDVIEWEDIEFTMDGLGKQYKEEDNFFLDGSGDHSLCQSTRLE
jgi:hypothetical protein